MEAIIEHAAGLDVHQSSVVACVISGAAGRRASRETRTFGAMKQDLAGLREWLLEKGVTHVGMEATGVHWQPVHAALEGAFPAAAGLCGRFRLRAHGRGTSARWQSGSGAHTPAI
jgi:transposase